MIILGLTGSIGMGKSTLAEMLTDMGIPVHDSDACVHELLSPGGAGVQGVAEAFPYFKYPQIYDRKSKAIMRGELGKIVFKDAEKRALLESIIHPLVRKSQQEFLKAQQRAKRDMVVLDIPLLFETGAESRVDYVLVVSAPAHVQKARVLERPGMTEEKFHAIVSRQMPDAEKCAKADYVIPTGLNLAETRKTLTAVLEEIRAKDKNHE